MSVHREGVDPNSMEGVRDLNHIGVEVNFIFIYIFWSLQSPL